MKRGDTHGHGLHGILTEEAGKLLCHECGGRYASLGVHARMAHGIPAREYKRVYGLDRGQSLNASGLRRVHSEASKSRVGTAAWRAFEESRDPTAASHARDKDAFEYRAASKDKRSETSRRNIKGTTKPRTRTCVVCGDYIPKNRREACEGVCIRILLYERSDMARADEMARLRGEGWTLVAIGERFGCSHPNVRYVLGRRAQYLQDLGALRERKPDLARWG